MTTVEEVDAVSQINRDDIPLLLWKILGLAPPAVHNLLNHIPRQSMPVGWWRDGGETRAATRSMRINGPSHCTMRDYMERHIEWLWAIKMRSWA